MDATMPRKTAAELAADTIESLRQNRSRTTGQKTKKRRANTHLDKIVLALAIILPLAYLAHGTILENAFPNHVVRGTVSTRKGPIANANVTFLSPESKKTYAVKTDGEGRYQMKIPHGTFKVTIIGKVPPRYSNPLNSPLKADVFHDYELDFPIPSN